MMLLVYAEFQLTVVDKKQDMAVVCANCDFKRLLKYLHLVLVSLY